MILPARLAIDSSVESQTGLGVYGWSRRHDRRWSRNVRRAVIETEYEMQLDSRIETSEPLILEQAQPERELARTITEYSQAPEVRGQSYDWRSDATGFWQ